MILERITTLANAITMMRIALIPAFFVVAAYHLRTLGLGDVGDVDRFGLGLNVTPTFQPVTRILLIFIAATDFLDGYVARRTQTVTKLGSLLDPLADKLFVFSSFLLFVSYQKIPMWLAVVCISKDVLVLFGWALLTTIENEVIARPLVVGKWTTAFCFGTIGVVVFNFPFEIQRLVFIVTGILASICFMLYLWEGVRLATSDSSTSSTPKPPVPPKHHPSS